MNLETLLIQTQSWAQAEAAAQSTLANVLERLETAVRDSKTEELVDAGLELERALTGGTQREILRSTLMDKFAELWSVPARTLSLTSIIERAEAAGADASVLRGQRDELRSSVTEVRRRARLLTVMATHHRGVLAELMEILGTGSSCPEARSEGVLVDASA